MTDVLRPPPDRVYLGLMVFEVLHPLGPNLRLGGLLSLLLHGRGAHIPTLPGAPAVFCGFHGPPCVYKHPLRRAGRMRWARDYLLSSSDLF